MWNVEYNSIIDLGGQIDNEQVRVENHKLTAERTEHCIVQFSSYGYEYK